MIIFFILTIIIFAIVDYSTSALLFFVISPMIYDLDCIVKNWWNCQKTSQKFKKSSLKLDDV
jgi:hypothetical protein